MNEKRLKIAMIGHKRIPSREGGVEIVVGELTKRLSDMGHQVTVYNRKSKNVATKDTTVPIKEYYGATMKWIPTPNDAKFNAIVYSFFATLEACFSDVDLIHFHAEGPASMVLLAKLFRKKCVVTIHGLDWQRSKWGGFATKFLLFGEKVAAKHADEIIVLSRNVQNYFLSKYGRQTTFVPNGISKPQKRPCGIISDKFGLEKDNYILYLGRIVPEKGIEYLIKAYKNTTTDKKLVIAGGSSHTDEYLDSLTKAYESDKIIFTGFVEGQVLDELYSNSYIYCLPSDVEGMPISLLEAMSYGNCCLTSDIEECKEVVGCCGIFFKKGNVEDLTDKLSTLLNDKETVKEYKADSCDYILTKFHWNDITKSTIVVYKMALNK